MTAIPPTAPTKPFVPPTFPVPNQEIEAKFKRISDIDGLKKEFVVLKDTPTTQIQWNKTSLLGTFVLGALATFVYMRVHQYIAYGVGILAIGALLKARVTVPTENYKKQCLAIQETFKGIAPELRQTWEVASKLITEVINTRKYSVVDIANNDIPGLVNSYMLEKTSWFGNSDVFAKVKEEDKPWRGAFKTLYPFADSITKIDIKTLKDDKDLHPVVYDELKKVHDEAVRLINGTSPIDPKKVAYVDNQLTGEENAKVVTSKPWPASELKA